MIDISLIIPIRNEQENIKELVQRLKEVLDSLQKSYEIIFIDDGSTDQSYAVVSEMYQLHKNRIKCIRFARNFGHQLAITAGLNHSQGRCAIVMDADLQDPPELIEQLVTRWQEGFDVVYALRQEREGETFIKKTTAKIFYKLLRSTTVIDFPENVGDFYLLDRKVIDVLNSLHERHRFVRGLTAWVGFKRTTVPYIRKPRFAGKTKYTFWRMVKFSLDAMTSFSFAPLRFVSLLGAFFSIVSFLSILLIIYMKLFTDATIIGWSSLMAVILFIGGIQLLAIGIIGEYIARIGDDVKARPLYTISEMLK